MHAGHCEKKNEISKSNICRNWLICFQLCQQRMESFCIIELPAFRLLLQASTLRVAKETRSGLYEVRTRKSKTIPLGLVRDAHNRSAVCSNENVIFCWINLGLGNNFFDWVRRKGTSFSALQIYRLV